MLPHNVKTTMRMAMASFVAGAGAVMLVGLVAPVAMQGGLSVRDAFAATVEQRDPLIEPLDVVAIQAQLNESDRLMAAMRASTDDEVALLARLAARP